MKLQPPTHKSLNIHRRIKAPLRTGQNESHVVIHYGVEEGLVKFYGSSMVGKIKNKHVHYGYKSPKFHWSSFHYIWERCSCIHLKTRGLRFIVYLSMRA